MKVADCTTEQLQDALDVVAFVLNDYILFKERGNEPSWDDCEATYSATHAMFPQIYDELLLEAQQLEFSPKIWQNELNKNLTSLTYELWFAKQIAAVSEDENED